MSSTDEESNEALQEENENQEETNVISKGYDAAPKLRPKEKSL
jgi:hypothetical protein